MTSPFITTQDAARYLLLTDDGTDGGVPDMPRLYKFLARHPEIERKHRGRSVLIDKQSLDAHLNRFSPVSRRHGASVAPSSSSAKGTTRDLAQEAH